MVIYQIRKLLLSRFNAVWFDTFIMHLHLFLCVCVCVCECMYSGGSVSHPSKPSRLYALMELWLPYGSPHGVRDMHTHACTRIWRWAHACTHTPTHTHTQWQLVVFFHGPQCKNFYDGHPHFEMQTSMNWTTNGYVNMNEQIKDEMTS